MASLSSIKNIPVSLKRACLVFIFVIIVTLAGIFASYYYVDEINQQKLAVNQAMSLWQSKINTSVQNNQIINEFEKNFIKLVNQGVIGDEMRLNWFETIQNTARKRGMPLVKDSISARHKLKNDKINQNFPGIDVYKSTMTLSLKMGHEGDLFALLNNLQKARGLFAVDSCDIQKVNKRFTDNTNNLKALCKLGWYTLKSRQSAIGNHHES